MSDKRITDLYRKIHASGFSLQLISTAISVHRSAISNFIHRRYRKVGRSNRKRIRQYFIDQGWLPKPKLRPRCSCILCGKVHAKSKHPVSPPQHHSQYTDCGSSTQSQSHSKNATTDSQ